MTTHSLLLNSITFQAHIQCLVLHRQEEAEQAHSFHQPVWLSAVPGGTGGLQVGCTAHLCWPACWMALGEPASRSDQVLVTAFQKKYGHLCSGETNSCQHSGATQWHLLMGSLEYINLAFTYTDWFFTTIRNLREAGYFLKRTEHHGYWRSGRHKNYTW